MFDNLSLDGVYVSDLTREGAGEAARLISAELYRRDPSLASYGFDDLEYVEAAKGDLRMEDKPLKDLNCDEIDKAALLLQHRIRELDEEFDRVYGCKIDEAWLEARMYEDNTRANAAVSSAEEVAGIAAGRIKREDCFNPFAPDSDCNPFKDFVSPGLSFGE